MELGLKGKVALVTGGSRGIGKAIATRLAQEGATVALSYASNQGQADDTVAAITAAGGQAKAFGFDVGDADACKDAIGDIAKAFGRLDILVNNAGVSRDGLLMRYKDADLEQSYRTNVFGPFFLSRAASRHMMKARWGRIIMLGSVVGSMGNVGQAAYAGTKSALVGMTRSLARELASRQITANVVAPGFIATDMTETLPAEAKEAMLGAIALGRPGLADEVADAVAFLASERAAYITGEVLHINGGLRM